MLPRPRADVADHAGHWRGESEPVLPEQLRALLGERGALAGDFGLRLLGRDAARGDLGVEPAQGLALAAQPLVEPFEVELKRQQGGAARFDLTLRSRAF